MSISRGLPRLLLAPVAFCSSVALAALPSPSAGQTPPPPGTAAPKAQVMVLGVYHFDNPNQDYVKTDVDDHRSPRRQKEIAEVVDLLAAFQPTKIALEAVDNVTMARRYNAYLAGSGELGNDERDQLGLRLARRLGHARVYAIDHKLDMDFERVMAAAQEARNTAFLTAFGEAMTEVQAQQKRLAALTVRRALIELNDPAELQKVRDLYLQLTRVRLPDAFVGADVLAGWYQRNFRIFANLVPIVEPGDRVLVIFGAGHAPYLRELVESSADLEFVEPNAALRAAR